MKTLEKSEKEKIKYTVEVNHDHNDGRGEWGCNFDIIAASEAEAIEAAIHEYQDEFHDRCADWAFITHVEEVGA